MIKFLAHKSGSTLISSNGFVDVPSRTVFSLEDHVLESGLFDGFISRGILKVFQTVEAASAWLSEENALPTEQLSIPGDDVLSAVTPAAEMTPIPEVLVSPLPLEQAEIPEAVETPPNPAAEVSASPVVGGALVAEATQTPAEAPVTSTVEENVAEVPDPDVVVPAKKTRAKQS